MTLFKYKVKDKAGKTIDGVMEANDEREVSTRLREMGYFILNIQKESEPRAAGLGPLALFVRLFINPIFAGASPIQLAVFYRQFATMVNSGMTIVQAISMLQKQGGSWVLRKIAREVLPLIQSGSKLSDSFSRYPWVFPELHISLLRAAEESGNLDKTLERIAEYMEREVNIRRKLSIATLYPKILVVAYIFIPNIPILILGTPREYIKSCLNLLVPILIGLLAFWVAFRILTQIVPFRYMIDMLKLAIPRVGAVVRMLALGRFYHALAALYAAGVPAAQALEHASKAAGNYYLSSKLNKAVPNLRQGRQLSDSLERTYVIPPTALEMLRTGEQSGMVDSMLEKMAEYVESDAQVAIVKLTVVGSVLLFLGVAAYIGKIVVSFYASYYSNILKH